MNALECMRVFDELAVSDPDRCGYGYADSQHPWHHDPAFDHPRQALLDFVQFVLGHAARPAVLLVGLGRRGTLHRAMQAIASRVASVEPDPAAQQALAAATTGPTARLITDALDGPAAAAALAAAAPFDMLLLDAPPDAVAGLWRRHAPLVRGAGIVAVVDRSQAYPEYPELAGTDAFLAALERDVLVPAGARLIRFGGATGIAAYVQPARVGGDVELPGPPPPPPQSLGVHCGFSLHPFRGRALAVRPPMQHLCLRTLRRNGAEVVLAAADVPAAAAAAAAFVAAADPLAAARAALAANDLARGRAIVAALRRDLPDLGAAAADSLELVPWNKPLLLALGTLTALGDAPREGVALLHRALRSEMVDAELMRVVAACYLHVQNDERAARRLLAEARAEVGARRVAQVCHQQLRGHVLWHYPKLLTEVAGVLQVGAGSGGLVAAWQALGIARQCYVEPQPEAFRRLEQRCRAEGARGARTLCAAVGSAAGRATLRWGRDPEAASLLTPHRLAGAAAIAQTDACEVAVTTLDMLAQNGAFEPREHDLLFVDTEGTELDVLRGAVECLRHVERISVRVFLQPVYEGVPLPEQIQHFLRAPWGEHTKDGFQLRAFETCADPARGDAVFTRIRRRR